MTKNASTLSEKKATFKDGQRISVKGREGERVMYLAHRKGKGF